MPSLRAKVLNFYLRRQMKAKPLHLMPSHVLTAGAERLTPKRLPKGVSLEHVEDGAVKGEWLRAGENADGLTIQYFHGGGYYYASPKAYRSMTSGLAAIAKANVFSQDYRLAPDHVFPAAVEDAVQGYRWLLDGGADPAKFFVSGDSAGGGLAIALMLRCREEGIPLPAGAILYSPWMDLANTGASFLANAKSDVMFKPEYIEGAARIYLDGADAKTPLASPLYADLQGLSPMLIFASADEMLFDDATRFHERAIEAGVKAELISEKGLAHVWPIFYPRIPEAEVALRQSAEFIREQMK